MKQGNYFSGSPVSINRKKLNGYGKTHSLESLITEEELKFLRLIGTDRTYEAIASDMAVSRRHAEYIRESLFEKFEVNNRVELALFASKGGVYH
jgi:two-component system invasion response regulator UvrY